MKRITAFIIALLMLCVPLAAFAENAAEPPAEEQVVPSQLSIDNEHIYKGMNKTYANGYIPTVKDGRVTIVLPLVGETKNNRVELSVDLGSAADSPFVFGNYSQTAKNGSPYVFTLNIPLANGRVNGNYPVTMNASYIDSTGMYTMQSFQIYVVITDGKAPDEMPPQEAVQKPELFIKSCVLAPNVVAGGEEFSVDITIENIGKLNAQSVLLTYGTSMEGMEASDIMPTDINNVVHLKNIGAGKSLKTSFKFAVSPDASSGNHSFSVQIDYSDAFGGVYALSRSFTIKVEQPAEMQYDNIIDMVPKTITAGETFVLPANVYNTGRSTLKNVMISVKGTGLFPKSAVFLGDILPGESGFGELSVFVGQLSMSDGNSEDYGRTNGTYTISYTDENGEEHTLDIEFNLEVVKPIVEETEVPDETELTEEPAFQWWVTILVGFAIIAIIVSTTIASKFIRAAKIGGNG